MHFARTSPHDATCGAAQQPRHTRCAHAGRGAQVPGPVPERPAGGGDSARAVVAAAARRGAAHAAVKVGGQIRRHLDARGLAALDVDADASRSPEGVAGRAWPCRAGAAGHALRTAVDRQRARCTEGTGRDAHPGGAAVSTVLGRHHCQHVRRRRRLDFARAPRARAARGQPVPRRRGLHRRAGLARDASTGCARAAAACW